MAGAACAQHKAEERETQGRNVASARTRAAVCPGGVNVSCDHPNEKSPQPARTDQKLGAELDS